MRKGQQQCSIRSCRRAATGSLLCMWGSRLYGGSLGCQEHLEEATRREVIARLTNRSTGSLIVELAKKGGN